MSATDWVLQGERIRLERCGATPEDIDTILTHLGPDSPQRASRNARHHLIGHAGAMISKGIPVELIVTIDTHSWYDLADAASRTTWTTRDLIAVTKHLLAHPQDEDVPLDALTDLATSTRDAQHALDVINAAGTYDLTDAAWLAGGTITIDDIAWVATHMPDRGLPSSHALEQIATIPDTTNRRLVLAMASGPSETHDITDLYALASSLTAGHDIALRLVLDDWQPKDAIIAAQALDDHDRHQPEPDSAPSVRINAPRPTPAPGRDLA